MVLQPPGDIPTGLSSASRRLAKDTRSRLEKRSRLVMTTSTRTSSRSRRTPPISSAPPERCSEQSLLERLPGSSTSAATLTRPARPVAVSRDCYLWVPKGAPHPVLAQGVHQRRLAKGSNSRTRSDRPRSRERAQQGSWPRLLDQSRTGSRRLLQLFRSRSYQGIPSVDGSPTPAQKEWHDYYAEARAVDLPRPRVPARLERGGDAPRWCTMSRRWPSP